MRDTLIDLQMPVEGPWVNSTLKTLGKERKPKALRVQVVFEDDAMFSIESPEFASVWAETERMLDEQEPTS